MKFKKLRRFLIKLCIIFAAILAIAGAGYYFISDWDDSLNDEIQQLKSSAMAFGR